MNVAQYYSLIQFLKGLRGVVKPMTGRSQRDVFMYLIALGKKTQLKNEYGRLKSKKTQTFFHSQNRNKASIQDIYVIYETILLSCLTRNIILTVTIRVSRRRKSPDVSEHMCSAKGRSYTIHKLHLVKIYLDQNILGYIALSYTSFELRK